MFVGWRVCESHCHGCNPDRAALQGLDGRTKQDGHAALLSFGVSQKAVQNFQREMLGRLKRRARIQMKDLDDVHSSIGLRLYQADVVTL